MSKKTWTRLLLIVCFAIPFAFSFPVWFSKRDFPVTPIFNWSIEFGQTIDFVFLSMFALFAFWFLLKERGKGGFFFFIMYVVFCILDQTRIQPFFFEIAILVLFYYLFRNYFKHFKIALLILMAGSYIWSGLHKINPTFFELWLGGLNKRIPFIPLFLRKVITYGIPILEMTFGLALLFKSTRKLGILLLAIMHSMVIVTLLLDGSGFTVLPLNIINVLLLIMLCYRLDWNILKLKSSNLKLKIIALYALVLPSLNFVGLYDHLLAFSYFSGKPSYANIVFNDSKDVDKLPLKLQEVTRTYNEVDYINLNEWSVKYVNVLCYPEERVYIYLQNYIESITGKNTTTLQHYKK